MDGHLVQGCSSSSLRFLQVLSGMVNGWIDGFWFVLIADAMDKSRGKLLFNKFISGTGTQFVSFNLEGLRVFTLLFCCAKQRWKSHQALNILWES